MTYGLTKDRTGKIVGWKSNEQEPAHTPETTHFAYVPDVVYVQFFEKDGKPAKWKHSDVPGTSGVCSLSEEGQSHLAHRWQPRPSGEAAPDPACARLDVHVHVAH